MTKMYANQTLLKIIFDTKIDLTDIVTATIKWRRNNETGTFTGSVDAPATGGLVSFNYDGTLKPGLYTFWVLLADASAKVIPTDPVELTFYLEGK